jgi:hypothetical protein
MRNALISRLLVAFLAAVITTGAAAEEWVVARLSGEVWIATAGLQTVSLQPDSTLSEGGVVMTGTSGRVLLVRGEQSMTVGPNAVVGVPAGRNGADVTTILQEAGVVEFEVDKRHVKHFAVETPYLAAVVKGTHFVVGAFETSGVVKVARGRVEVTNLVTGQVVDVLPDQQASVSASGSLDLSGSGDFEEIREGAPPPDIPGEMPASNQDDSTLTLAVGGENGIGVSLGAAGLEASVGGVGGGVALDLGRAISLDSGGSNGIAATIGVGGVSVGLGGISVPAGGLLGGLGQ